MNMALSQIHPAPAPRPAAADRLKFDLRRYDSVSTILTVETHDDWSVAEIEIDTPHNGRAEFNAEFYSRMRPHYFWAIHRRAKHMIADAHLNGVRRVWTTIDAGDDFGHRWLRLLGFQPEGLMRGYTREGRDAVMYARVSR